VSVDGTASEDTPPARQVATASSAASSVGATSGRERAVARECAARSVSQEAAP
jgi:hypothetical protein